MNTLYRDFSIQKKSIMEKFQDAINLKFYAVKYILGVKRTHNNDLSQDFPLNPFEGDLANSLDTPFNTSSTNSFATFFKSSAIITPLKNLTSV